MPPTAKSVLMAMADYSDDGGECWPSIYTLCRDTCFSERAIHGAIKWLEAAGLVTADRSNGRHTRYVLTPANLDRVYGMDVAAWMRGLYRQWAE